MGVKTLTKPITITFYDFRFSQLKSIWCLGMKIETIFHHRLFGPNIVTVQHLKQTTPKNNYTAIIFKSQTASRIAISGLS